MSKDAIQNKTRIFNIFESFLVSFLDSHSFFFLLAALGIESRTKAKQALSSISDSFIIFYLSQDFTKLFMVVLNVRSF